MSRLQFAVLLLAICPVMARAADQALPRYALKPGQEMTFESSALFKFDAGAFDTSSTITAWVTGLNADGSWHLIVRNSSVFKDTRYPSNQPPQVSFMWFDLFPDGRTHVDAKMVHQFDPATLFARLPASAEELKSGWSDTDSATDTFTKSKALDNSKPGAFVFEATPVCIYDNIYGMAVQRNVELDVARGVPVSIDSTTAQTYGFNGKGTGTLKLKSLEMKDAAAMEQLAKEFAVAFKATETPGEISKLDDPAKIEEAYGKQAAAMRGALAEVTLPEAKDLLNDALKGLPNSLKWAKEQATNIAKVKSAPAADWSAKDLDGKPYTLKSLRGRVVVLDYWYRGCGWCMRAMPQIKMLAEDYKEKPVVILGMNTDRELSDAKFVVEAMQLNYPVLQATDLVETYSVGSFGFPTLVIIDQQGIVRDMHIGYSATLKEDVSKTIDGLLATK